MNFYTMPRFAPAGAPFVPSVPNVGGVFAPKWNAPLRIVNMPLGGRVWINGRDVSGRWEDAALTRWVVLGPAGGGSVVVDNHLGAGRRTANVLLSPYATAQINYNSMSDMASYVPPSGGLYRPSGLASAQILDLQGALVALGHLSPGMFTPGVMPVAPYSALMSFQRNYNAEQRNRNFRYNPRQIGEDGQWGSQTQAALTNYIPWARGVLAQRGITLTSVLGPAVQSTTVPGVSIAPYTVNPTPSSTPPKVGGPTDTKGTPDPQRDTAIVRPSPSPSPAVVAPTVQQAAAPFPTGPVIAGALGLAAIAGVVIWKSGQKRKGK